ncbi:MAG TPA: hypothetical protein VFK09_12250, partial [Gemmatimonadales bacterium]|nr:hypothetical protein [Gemmatimonadales bacterium]
QSLETLERTVPPVSASGARGEAAEPEWQEAMLAAARRLDSAWLALEAAARAEQSLWAAEVARVRAWRRPTRPLWVASALVILVALYLGLVLGGYFGVPGPLRPLAEAWWSRLP